MEEQKPLRVNIRVAKSVTLLGSQISETKETEVETALRMVEEVKKVHPNAEISVEVDA